MEDILSHSKVNSSLAPIKTGDVYQNGTPTLSRAEGTSALLQPVLSQLTRFMVSADSELQTHLTHDTLPSAGTTLVNPISLSPKALSSKIESSLSLGDEGTGQAGLLSTLDKILTYSVNTNAPGFLDKLYASPLPPGIAAELILAVLNTNLHVYQVSPVLTLIEQRVTKSLAKLFGFTGPRAGGISVQGGSASNMTSIVVARNTLFPETKTRGNSAAGSGDLLLFTSAHGHYSIEKAAQALGFGSKNVIAVPVDDEGRMKPAELERLIQDATTRGHTPFYINATAGSTVLGSFDPFHEIAVIAKKHRCWLHVDGAWGGSFVFARRSDIKKYLNEINEADSIAINPHKMLGVPVTCSFLLTRDLKLFESAMTLRAGYLFHEADIDDDTHGNNDETIKSKDINDSTSISQSTDQSPLDLEDGDNAWSEPNDLADLTLQCGRRGDSLKFFLSWQYYGTNGYRKMVENAYDIALHFSQVVSNHKDLTLVLGENKKPQCLQVCFYYTPQGHFLFDTNSSPGSIKLPTSTIQNSSAKRILPDGTRNLCGRYNTLVTSRITKALIAKGFMIDYAPALEGQEDRGSFFRVVVNISTVKETVERLVHDLCSIGEGVVRELRSKYQ